MVGGLAFGSIQMPSEQGSQLRRLAWMQRWLDVTWPRKPTEQYHTVLKSVTITAPTDLEVATLF